MKSSRLNRILPGVVAALAVFSNLNAADTDVPAEITGVVPEAGAFKLLYRYDLMSGTGFGDRSRVNYLTDNSAELSKNAVVKVAYFMDLAGKDGGRKWVYVAMDAFDPNAIRMGVPTAATGSEKAAAVLADWVNTRPMFVKVFPVEYRQALGRMAREDAEAVDRRKEDN